MGKIPPGRTAEGRGAEPVASASAEGLARAPASDEAGVPFGEPSLETLRAIEAELEPYFPAPVDQTELVLMDVDPRRIHAYWHVSPTDLEAAGFVGTSPPLVLRVYDVTDATAGAPGSEFFDVDVQGLESRCYVDLWQAGRAYDAELALRSAGGTLQTLARSNRVQTPREQPDSGVRGPERPPPSVPGEASPLTASQTHDAVRATLRLAAADEAAGPSVAQAVIPGQGADAAVPREGFGNEPTGGASLPGEADVGGELAAATPASTARSAPPSDLPPPLAAGTEVETVEAALCEPPPALSQEFPNAAPEEGRPEDSIAFRHEPAVDGAILPPVEDRPARGHEAPAGEAAGVPLVTFSSSSLAGSESVLEVHAELHVFGRARPGSRLRIFGRPVALRPDGSFSVRRPLPAGAVVLPLELEEPESGAAPSPEGH